MIQKTPELKKRSKRFVSSKINKEISSHIGRIANQIAKGKRNEEETRRWCVDMLRYAFGYTDKEIETEASVLGKRVDIALLDGEKIIAVIECKAATVRLGGAAINQAANYAVALGAEWSIVTNGHQWMMFHVVPVRGSEPVINMMFDVSVLDEDGLSKEDVSYLYLITKQAILSGETKMVFHENEILSCNNIKNALSSPEVISVISEKLKSSYEAEHNVVVDADQAILKNILEFVIDDFENSV